MRRVYLTKEFVINGKTLSRVIIDPHVDKHRDHMSDQLIVELVQLLVDVDHAPCRYSFPFEYYATRLYYRGKWLRLVWLLENDSDYLGVITAYRDRRFK